MFVDKPLCERGVVDYIKAVRLCASPKLLPRDIRVRIPIFRQCSGHAFQQAIPYPQPPMEFEGVRLLERAGVAEPKISPFRIWVGLRRTRCQAWDSSDWSCSQNSGIRHPPFLPSQGCLGRTLRRCRVFPPPELPVKLSRLLLELGRRLLTCESRSASGTSSCLVACWPLASGSPGILTSRFGVGPSAIDRRTLTCSACRFDLIAESGTTWSPLRFIEKL